MISRQAGFGYMGATILGALALTTDDNDERQRALNDGEAALRAGAVSHNHLYFYRDAMETALRNGDWEGAERYAAALESYTRPEPLPWAEFFIARSRALAGYGRGRRDASLIAELRRIRDEGERLGFKPMLASLDAALASTSSA